MAVAAPVLMTKSMDGISLSSPCPLYHLTQPGTPVAAVSLPGDPTMNNPCYLTPGTGTEIILNQPSASANMTESCARDTVTSFDPPHQSLSPRTPAADADLPENLLPPRNQTHAGIILRLPAQQPRAQTSNSRPIPKKRKPTNLASSSQNDADLRENLLPPRTQNQTHGGIVLCLPAQQPRAQTSNSRPIPQKRKPKNLASSSQNDADLHENLLPPHTQNQTHGDIVLCLPVQQPQPQSSNSRPIPRKRKPKNLASLSQDDAVLHENLLPPHTQNQTHDGSVVCLPAQKPRAHAQTSKPPPIPRKRKPKILAPSSQAELDESPSTFWTLCPSCNLLYEYINPFLNQELLCHECGHPFVATKRPAPTKAHVQKFLAESYRSWTGEEYPASVFNADTSAAKGEKTSERRRAGTKGTIPCEDPAYDSSATE